MRGPSRYFWVAVAVLALTGLAPSTARANCGHYVIIRSPLPDTSAAATNDPARPMPSEPPSPADPGPCRGPGCSQGGDRLPLLPPPTTEPVGGERWGHHLLQNLRPDGPTDSLPLPLVTVRPLRGGSSVYHPPR